MRIIGSNSPAGPSLNRDVRFIPGRIIVKSYATKQNVFPINCFELLDTGFVVGRAVRGYEPNRLREAGTSYRVMPLSASAQSLAALHRSSSSGLENP
jgi:hypothetical protein